jgi:hypothetical protein
VIVTRLSEAQLVEFSFAQSNKKSIEDVIVPLSFLLVYQPGLLKKVLIDQGSFNDPSLGEVYVNELAKSRGVVISNSFGISKSCNEKGSIDLSLTAVVHSYLPISDWNPEPVAQSTSVVHSLQPKTEG